MIEFLNENCVRDLFAQASCSTCVTSCPHNVINVNKNNKVIFNHELCKDCGLCITACEQGAFQSKTYQWDYPNIKKYHKGYSCFEVELKDDVIRIPCLGMIDETEFITSAIQNKSHIHIWTGNCKDCQWKIGEEQLEKCIEIVKAISDQFKLGLKIIKHSPTIEKKVVKDTREPVLNKRDFFFKGFKWVEENSKALTLQKVIDVYEQIKTVEHLWMQHSDEIDKTEVEGHLPPRMQKKITRRRYTLLKSLTSQGHSLEEPIIGLANPKLIHQHCDACELCVYSCTTGALQRELIGNKIKITFSLNFCLNCSVCIDVCPREAICSSEAYKKELITIEKRSCKKCNASFVSPDNNEILCKICKNKQNLIFM